MSQLIKEQGYGVEIELTGITRERASQIIAEYFGTSNSHIGGSYDKWIADDRNGRTWTAMSDSSIRPERKLNGQLICAGREYQTEVVTPVLQYSDLEDLQQVVRLLRHNGAIANSSTGIHVHVDASRHTPETITRVLEFATGRQDLFYEALGITAERENRWTKKINHRLTSAMKREGKTEADIYRLWYSRTNDGGGCGAYNHYDQTRYHGVNLHSYFQGKGLEFRLFNGTTHSGKIKAYIQFCLAISAWGIESGNSKVYFKKTNGMSQVEKAKLMDNVLVKRLGMSGKEFKNARVHLTANFIANITEQVAIETA